MLYAVGVIELRNIAKGVEACDSALKSAGVRLISAHAACPGKYEILVTGVLADVQTALEHVQAAFGPYLIDSTLLGRIEPSVVKALMGAQEGVLSGALGIVETFTAAAAIKAADTAVKTAKVEILDLRVSRGMGGKGVLMVTGDVSDVTAAVEAGSLYAKEQGLFCSSSVIAAPHPDLWQYM